MVSFRCYSPNSPKSHQNLSTSNYQVNIPITIFLRTTKGTKERKKKPSDINSSTKALKLMQIECAFIVLCEMPLA